MVQHFTVVFVVVLIGYYALSRSNQYRERLLTASNYALLYESAIAGLSIFATVWLIVFAIKRFLLDCDDIDQGQVLCEIDQYYPLPFLDILLVSALFAWVSKYLDNWLLTDEELGVQIARKSGLIANVVLDALAGDHLVQITTLSGKVYIGWILLGPGVSRKGDVEDIAVVPLYSGHRDRETQRAIKDIDYSVALLEYAELVKGDGEEVDLRSPQRPEMSVVIPIGEIALIRRHSEELEQFFFPIDEAVN